MNQLAYIFFAACALATLGLTLTGCQQAPAPAPQVVVEHGDHRDDKDARPQDRDHAPDQDHPRPDDTHGPDHR